VQETYDRALRRVLADLTATNELGPTVTVDLADPRGLPYQYLATTGGTHQHALTWCQDEEEAAVTLADLVQDDVFDELRGPVWPTCPGHNHPATPILLHGEAVWACPESCRQIATIGRMGS
jgi:hypothetical protein